MWAKDPNTLFVFWFDESVDEARANINNEQIELVLAREINHHHLNGRTVVFGEHHPMHKKEEDVFHQLQLKEVKILSALDEPLFRRFGSEKIVGMLKHMGMKEDAPLENQMISNAIRNAQQKIEKQVVMEHSAPSQKSWLEKNLPADKHY